VPFPALFLFTLHYSVYSIDTTFILGDGLTRLLRRWFLLLLPWYLLLLRWYLLLLRWEKSAQLLSCSWIFLG
jgi:hypothetical protein